jgi:hypothetical protein
MEYYGIKITDYRSLIRQIIGLVVVVIIFIVSLIIWEKIENPEINPNDFMIGMLIASVVIPFTVLILFKFNTSKKDICLSNEGVSSKKFGHIPYSQIIKFETPLNNDGFHTLIIVKLNDGRKFSFNSLNKYNGLNNEEFNRFFHDFSSRVKNYL